MGPARAPGRRAWAGTAPPALLIMRPPCGDCSCSAPEKSLLFSCLFCCSLTACTAGSCRSCGSQSTPSCCPLPAAGGQPCLAWHAWSCHQQAYLVSAGPPSCRLPFLKHPLLSLAQHEAEPAKRLLSTMTPCLQGCGGPRKGWQQQCDARRSACISRYGCTPSGAGSQLPLHPAPTCPHGPGLSAVSRSQELPQALLAPPSP